MNPTDVQARAEQIFSCVSEQFVGWPVHSLTVLAMNERFIEALMRSEIPIELQISELLARLQRCRSKHAEGQPVA